MRPSILIWLRQNKYGVGAFGILLALCLVAAAWRAREVLAWVFFPKVKAGVVHRAFLRDEDECNIRWRERVRCASMPGDVLTLDAVTYGKDYRCFHARAPSGCSGWVPDDGAILFDPDVALLVEVP